MKTLFHLVAIFLLGQIGSLRGGELLPGSDGESAPPPPPKPGEVTIEFAPPPLDGTISLGLYDAAGKLVRVLRDGAVEADFAKGLNGLIVRWDGKDDAGKTVVPGTYSARGMMVGDLVVEGEAYLGNDWIGQDGTPRLRDITSISAGEDGGLKMLAEANDGSAVLVEANADGEILKVEKAPPVVEADATVKAKDGKLFQRVNGAWQALELPDLGKVISVDLSASGTFWLIDTIGEHTDVKEFSPDGKFLRHLGISADGPKPVQIVSTQEGRVLYLREVSERETRIRGLALVDSRAEEGPGAAEISTWEVVLSQSIDRADGVASAHGLLGNFEEKSPMDVLLAANPLAPEVAQPKAAVQVMRRGDSTVFALADGLPLRVIATTPSLKWVALGQRKGRESLTVLQSDGAVIEEFTIHRPSHLAAIDAGEISWPAPVHLPLPAESGAAPDQP